MKISHYLDNISIGKKLFGGLILIVILMVFLGGICLITITGYSSVLKQAYEDQTSVIQKFNTIENGLDSVDSLVTRIIINPENKVEEESLLASKISEVDYLIGDLKNVRMSDDESNRYTNLFSQWNKFKTAINLLTTQENTGKAGEAKASVLESGDFSSTDEALNLAFEDLRKSVINEFETDLNNTFSSKDTLVLIVLIFMTIFIILSLLIGLLLTRNITSPLKEIVRVSDLIGKGDSSARVVFTRLDEIGIVGSSLNEMGTRISAMINDSEEVTKAIKQGNLAFRADSEHHKGDYKRIIQEFNLSLDAITDPLNLAAEYIDRIAKGDIPSQIQENYPGDFNKIKNNLNTCVEAVNLLIHDSRNLTDAAMKGELQIRADTSLHHGDFRKIVEGVNATLDAYVEPMSLVARYIHEMTHGSIPDPIKKEFLGSFEEIRQNLNNLTNVLKQRNIDMEMFIRNATIGNLDFRVDTTKYIGYNKELFDGINRMLDAIIGPLNIAAEYVNRIAAGDIPEKIVEEYQGDFSIIKINLNTCIDAVNLLISDSNLLTKAAVEGRLGTRADASRHQGDFKRIVDGVNSTLDAVIEPVHEAMRVSDEYAAGNFTARVNEELSVKGEFLTFKEALNRIGIELTRMMALINDELYQGVNVLSAASTEILSVTAQLSSSTAETATSVNETSATVEEVRKTTEVTNQKAKAVSDQGQAVNQVVRNGQMSVEEINTGMKGISSQMESIGANVIKLSEQSQAIGEIIISVNEIAEQSNLLAVNASIEAAKAGEFGKGFGVVAQEIKILAEQSKQATSNIRTILTEIQKGITATVISTEQGNKTVATGLKLTSDAKEAISVLSHSIAEAQKASIQIAASSQEQVIGMDQISIAMENIRTAAQNNLEVTRQVEKTAGDLHNLGTNLKEITERFRV